MKKNLPLYLTVFTITTLTYLTYSQIRHKNQTTKFPLIDELYNQHVTNCKKAGERSGWDESCCPGLIRVASDKNGFVITDGGGNCIKCGDKLCGAGESSHNCPQDCKN